MSENKGKADNPFASFSLIEGKIPVPTSDSDDDVVTGDDALLEDDSTLTEEEAALAATKAAADKKLEEVARIQAKKNKTEVIDEVDDTEEDTEDLEDDVVDNGFKSAIKHLSDKGILEISDDDIEDSEEGLEKAVDKTIGTRFEKFLQAKLGDEGLALLSYIEAGGDPKNFISTYYSDASWADYNVESEAAQKVALRESLRLKDESPEDIEDLIKEYEDNGTLEKRSKSALAYLQKLEVAQKAELIENQKKAAEQARNAEKKRFEDFKANILKKEEIKGFKLPPKQREKLIDFTTVVDKKTGKTAYQKAIDAEADASLMFAYFAMNDFDINKLEKQVVSKASSKLSGLLKNYKTPSRERLSSGRTEIDENGDNPFEGFKKVV